MAEGKSYSFTNRGAGPRSFFNGDGEAIILRAGQSYTGTVQGDRADLNGDLVDGEGDADSARLAELGHGDDIRDFGGYPELGDLSRDQLLQVARDEGYTSLADQPFTGTDDELREAISGARGEAAAQLQQDAEKLVKDNTRDELLKTATDEGVAVESDDNKADLALKIAAHRASAERAE